jgi:pimeloyl-ACP methyl ester carboxylesterase
MSEKLVTVNGVQLSTESFGDKKDQAVLLIMGASASMLWWDEEFCRQLAARGYFVIRYDKRDVGRSVTYEPGKPGYTLDDMADDAVGVLDAYGVERAHVVGASLGGMIAQMIALRHPQRVLMLTAMMSSVFGPDDPALPPMEKKVLDYYMSGQKLDWKDEKAAVDFSVGAWRQHTGSGRHFDDVRTRERAEKDFKRSTNMLSAFNHALLKGGEEYYGRIKEIKVPTLVIHGTEDPALPCAHGQALAREIPGATLLTLEGAGHEINQDDWDTIINAIVELTAFKA